MALKKPVYPISNGMSVDVEDYFQVSAFEGYIDRSEWQRLPGRVEANVDRILQLFSDHGIRATFFILGCIAERYPSLVTAIAAQGHEVASHGWEHKRIHQQSPAEFETDVKRTKSFLEDLSGEAVKGYRAASYSINRDTLWALDVLAGAGYRYSSSIVPISHDLYGIPDAPRFRFLASDNRLLEVPITTVKIGNRNINCGGGGWFRLFPYPLTSWAIRRVNTVEKQPAVFYFHPWEIDPEQPRVAGINRKTRFRHYLNLHKTYGRLERLLRDFSWDRMDHVFLDESGSNTPVRGRGEVDKWR